MRDLTPLEARVLAVLVEKQATVPDTYPLSLNALVAGCNQKTAREPVMETREADVAAAIDELKALALVVEVSGARVLRYEHNMGRVLALPGAAVALLAVLMLRGPQTAAELRQNAERLHRFADVSSAEGFLEELAQKTPPRVLRLARAPGMREPRWAHLLCGAVDEASLGSVAPGVVNEAGASNAVELEVLRAELSRQGQELKRLQALVERLARELGIAAD
ncbi:MAG: hypothetical protein AMXMBFR78_19730 [Rubrivivax sp.]